MRRSKAHIDPPDAVGDDGDANRVAEHGWHDIASLTSRRRCLESSKDDRCALDVVAQK